MFTPVSPDETSLRTMIASVAESLGWRWMHVRPARSSRPGVWLTPTDGPLGRGWPDLFLLRDGRALVVETKSATGTLTPEQMDVLARMALAGIETFVASPDKLRELEEVLR